MVELYLPRSPAGVVARTTARAHTGAAKLRAEGTPVRFLRSIFMPADEMRFLFFKSSSKGAVAEAARHGRITFERVVRAEVAANEKAHAEERQRRSARGIEEMTATFRARRYAMKTLIGLALYLRADYRDPPKEVER